jgi:hypothetical protein
MGWQRFFFAFVDVSDMSSIVPGGDTSKRFVEVTGLNPGTGYRFRVYSTNSYGVGPRSRPSGMELLVYNS